MKGVNSMSRYVHTKEVIDQKFDDVPISKQTQEALDNLNGKIDKIASKVLEESFNFNSKRALTSSFTCGVSWFAYGTSFVQLYFFSILEEYTHIFEFNFSMLMSSLLISYHKEILHFFC